MDLIKTINRLALIVLAPAAMAAAFIGPWQHPAGVLAGGLLGLLNLRGLAWGIRGMLGAEKIVGRAIFFSQFRLVMLLLALLLLVYLRLASLPGILAGFSIVFAAVLIGGFRNGGDPGEKPDSRCNQEKM